MKQLTNTKLILCIIIVVFAGFRTKSFSQTLTRAIIENGDTIPFVRLKGISVYGRLSADSRKKIIKGNHRLIYNIKKVMPYAIESAKIITDANAHIATLETDKEKNKYLKKVEKQLKSEYEDDIREMTFSQGKLLIKLIDRQCGSSSYDLIKLYKSGRSAFFWNGIAGLFGMDLKNEYDPKEEQEIEVILDYLGYS
ncbi:MAG: DUF4294 domain-containing protein [Bacteroidia bacterium]